MQEDVGIFRDEAGLTAALAGLEELKRRAADARSPSSTTAFNPGWHLCRDLRNMLIVSEAVARAACCDTRAAAPTAGSTFPPTTTTGPSTTSSSRKDADGHAGRDPPGRQDRRSSQR